MDTAWRRITLTMTDDRSETANQALEHAWNWFSLHAAQRMQTFHFFLVATAFLMAAYAALLEKHRWVALVVACVGAWIAFWFTRLDNRTWQLIKAGEDVLKICQSGLAKSAGIPALDMLQAVERPTDGASSYGL